MSKQEEDGTIIEEAEKLCKHALPIVIGSEDNVWCAKTSLICYKCLGEECELEEPVTTII
jgi:hypothetical protein